jgi:hypothetical protein
MKPTWKDTFEIIERMFDINPEDIAVALDVSPSTISRLVNNKTKKFTSLSHEEIYSCIFDPNSETCPLKGEKERVLLSFLKDAIIFVGFRAAMDDIWNYDTNYKDGNYKLFVMTLLKRTNRNRPPSVLDFEKYLFSAFPEYAAQRQREQLRLKWR